ncbi:hypothetical protein [Pseudotabrizicola sediminis]|uniref:hypothetical protein n=1 Tax=Pseudotabrizicola sediminis TaxID=2486418 RepID=UPI001080EF0E|nr:hypothetical protein [Pseudotabrizicola sediminis]
MTPPFVLLLAIWGTRYGPSDVNGIVQAAYRLSPGLHSVVLVTDRTRDGIDARVRQVAFPADYDRAEFFGRGYRSKLAVFSPQVVPPGLPCVFLDLDTVVIGDLGRIAALVQGPDDLFMLPPGGLGFGALRRVRDRVKGDGKFPVGNSSILAFHADAAPNLAETYASRFGAGDTEATRMVIDDVIIAWFGRGRVKGVPTSCGVMFRREFLSRVPGWAWFKAWLPGVQRRRSQIAAVTFNGVAVKPEQLATLAEGDTVSDGRGRSGPWTRRAIGPLWSHLQATVQPTAASPRPCEDHPG